MAQPTPDIQSILAALGETSSNVHGRLIRQTNQPVAAQRPAATPNQTPPGAPGQSYAPPGYGAPGQGLPAPASSGNVDLSAIRPVNSGTMSFDDVLSKARASAAQSGAQSYDRPLVYGAESRGSDRQYRRSRSRTPPRNDYRDDRRGGGHDRGYGRDRSYSPPARGRYSPRGSGGRDRSPLRGGGDRGGDDNSETIEIESSLVGLIIGRQGENLRRIEADSNCRVQFLAASDGGPFRQCRITGPRARRAEVKTAINRIIEDSGMGALNRAQEKPREAVKSGQPPLRDGEDHMQIMVPDRTVGLIIGRGGETIRDLQERSGCHINIVGESKSVNGLRPVNLIGSVESAARAKDFIMEIVDSDSRGEAPPAATKRPPMGGMGGGRDGPTPTGTPDKINDAVYVPSDAVGMIIGKGGETIREMQNNTGCKINVAQSSGPGEVQREIALIGSRDSIARAKQAIDEKVEAVVSNRRLLDVNQRLTYVQRQKNSEGGGRPAGRGRGYQDPDRPSYSQQGPSASTNSAAPPAAATGDGADPYAQCMYSSTTTPRNLC